MKVKTFIGQASIEGLEQMEQHINDWMAREGVAPSIVKQSFGTERHHGQPSEPALVISIWYEEKP